MRRGGDVMGRSLVTRLADTVGARVCLAPASTRCRRARHAAWGGSPVGGHGDVFSGMSTWTVTGPLFSLHCSLLVLLCALIRPYDYISADANSREQGWRACL